MKLSDDHKWLQASPVGRHKTIHRKTKLWIYNTPVLAVLLFGVETRPPNNKENWLVSRQWSLHNRNYSTVKLHLQLGRRCVTFAATDCMLTCSTSQGLLVRSVPPPSTRTFIQLRQTWSLCQNSTVGHVLEETLLTLGGCSQKSSG